MADEGKFGEQLYSRLQSGKGLSKYQVDKVLALQRLDPEVAELGEKGLLADAQLLEISKVNSAARQKQLAELTVEKSLAQSWVKELVKLVRSAEKARNDQEANKYWNFFFEIKEMIEREGPSRSVLQLIKNFRPDAAPIAQVQVFEGSDRPVVNFNKLDLEAGRGLDVGTVNICAAARKKGLADVVYNIQRNAFMDVRGDAYTRKLLMKLGIDFIQQGDKGYVIGDPAFELANVFEKNTRRPMKDGMISPVEPEALLIVSLIIAQCLGHPRVQGEVCAFSVPADPIDVERNVIYHRGALEAVLRKLGYTPKPMLEGHSIVFSELAEQDFTGIGISCGGGMFNVCVSYKSVPALTFATSRGGDWIDNNVGQALGMPAPMACAVKESGVDLMNPKDRIQDAICIYYRNLIQYTLETIRTKLESAQNMPTFTRPIDVVCGGGTSMVTGFIDVFREEFEKVNFPIEVANIRMANDPLKAVARGCMVAAIEDTKARSEDDVKLSPAAMQRTAATTTSIDSGTKRRLAPSMSALSRTEPQVVKASASPLPPMPTAAPKRDAPQVVKAAPLPTPATASGRSEAVVKSEPVRIQPAAPARSEAVVKTEPVKIAPAKRETGVTRNAAAPPPPPPPPPPAPLEELEEIPALEEVRPDDGDIPLIS
jgi:hypothetical protein